MNNAVYFDWYFFGHQNQFWMQEMYSSKRKYVAMTGLHHWTQESLNNKQRVVQKNLSRVEVHLGYEHE